MFETLIYESVFILYCTARNGVQFLLPAILIASFRHIEYDNILLIWDTIKRCS